MTEQPVRFHLSVPAEDVADLHRRIDATRWPAPSWQDADDWSYGSPEPYIRALTEYWRNDFDWRVAEAKINSFDQFRVPLRGRLTHFIHARSPHPEATPLLLVHGWPGSIVEFLDVIPRLTDPTAFGGQAEDAFHVVAPSLPGYGFSEPVMEPGFSPDRIAASYAELMALLGYERFLAQGGDWGAIVCRHLPDQIPDRLIGLHLNLVQPIPPRGLPDDPATLLNDAEREYLEHFTAQDWALHGYAHLQGTKPLTPSFALSDSPVGLAAWITEKFNGWTDNSGDLRDAVSWDALLTNISLYWFSNSIGSSVRLYREYFDSVAAGPTTAPRVTTPTGIAEFPAEVWRMPRTWIEQEYNLVHWSPQQRGGHFAAMEQPEAFSKDVLDFGRRLRSS